MLELAVELESCFFMNHPIQTYIHIYALVMERKLDSNNGTCVCLTANVIGPVVFSVGL